MKKTLVLVIVTMFASTTLCAQARALGGRSFYIGEAVSYQHQLTEKTMLEAELGLSLSSVGVEAVVTHDWLFPISSWQKRGTWNWYAGVGAGAGYNWAHPLLLGYYSIPYGFVGLAGRIGVEYNFDFPLNLSLDWRPIIGPAFGQNGLHGEGLYSGGLGIRYRF